MHTTALLIFALVCAASAASSTPAMRGAEGQGKKNIVELASATADLSTLVAALKAADLVSTLEGNGPLTVFAPTNEAFGKLPKPTLDFLLDPNNKAVLTKILTYHVAAGAAFSKDLKNGETIKTLEGNSVEAHVSTEGVKINDSDVTTADVAASNGVVHLIDAVLLPPDVSLPSSNIVDIAAHAPQFSSLVKALGTAGLVDTLRGDGPFTVFAPTDRAFRHIPSCHLKRLLADEAKLKEVLLYHVLPTRVYADEITSHDFVKSLEGSKLLLEPFKGHVFINRYAEVVKADIEGLNGNIHVINRVLFPLHLLHDFHHAPCDAVAAAEVDEA